MVIVHGLLSITCIDSEKELYKVINTDIDEIVASDAGTGATDVNTDIVELKHTYEEGLMTSTPNMEITSNSD